MLEKCGLCGREIPRGSGMIPHDHPCEIFCDECGTHRLYKCPTCVHAQKCGIQNYNGPKPKMVVHQVRQGPMVLEQQVINPELVEEICSTCVCGGMKNCQEIHTCGNYKGFFEEDK